MWFNPIMVGLLRSPFHPVVSGSIMVLALKGRRSGRTITTPVNYVQARKSVHAPLWTVSARDHLWWRNLCGGAPVTLTLRGRTVAARGTALDDQAAAAEGLAQLISLSPRYARLLGIRMAGGNPIAADLQAAAQRMAVVRFDMTEEAVA